VARHPLAGWGITGYGFLDAQYFRVLVELGIVGFGAFVLLLAACGRLFLRASRTLADPLHRGLALGLVAGLAGLMTHAIAANTFLIVRIMEPFWLLTGLLVAAIGLEEGT
jgi:O-antigen ligase